MSVQADETNMRHLMPLLAAGVSILSTGTAHADLGDQLFKLLAEDGEQYDWFGISAAISGDTAIVGAYQDDDNGSQSGSAYLFNTTTGKQIIKLLPNDGAPGDKFGRSVAIRNSPGVKIAIVGALFDDDNGVDSGSAYLFDVTTGQQISKLLPNDGAADDRFGYSVAISGGTAIVGAVGDDDNGSWSGSAYLFDIGDPRNPVQIAKLLACDGSSSEFFGHSVAISSNTAIVGVWAHYHHGVDTGAVYVYDVATGTQMAELLADDGMYADAFGKSVAISGAPGSETAIVGAIGDDDNGQWSGSAYLFDLSDPKNPLQVAKLLPDDGTPGDQFGESVAISGTIGIVGADIDDENGESSGSAYLFDTVKGVQLAKLLPGDGAAGDRFGYRVAVSGPPGMEIAIVGAFFDDDNGASSGSAYLFDAGDPGKCPWDLDGNDSVGASDLLSLLTSWGPCEGCPADFDGNGDVGASDLLTLLANWGPCL